MRRRGEPEEKVSWRGLSSSETLKQREWSGNYLPIKMFSSHWEDMRSLLMLLQLPAKRTWLCGGCVTVTPVTRRPASNVMVLEEEKGIYSRGRIFRPFSRAFHPLSPIISPNFNLCMGRRTRGCNCRMGGCGTGRCLYQCIIFQFRESVRGLLAHNHPCVSGTHKREFMTLFSSNPFTGLFTI